MGNRKWVIQDKQRSLCETFLMVIPATETTTRFSLRTDCRTHRGLRLIHALCQFHMESDAGWDVTGKEVSTHRLNAAEAALLAIHLVLSLLLICHFHVVCSRERFDCRTDVSLASRLK